MNPPTANQQQSTLTPQQQAALQRAKERRFSGILAVLEANSQIRDRALNADELEPPAPRGNSKSDDDS